MGVTIPFSSPPTLLPLEMLKHKHERDIHITNPATGIMTLSSNPEISTSFRLAYPETMVR
jgi:hypothetical protein